jgi:hypothetical protein
MECFIRYKEILDIRRYKGEWDTNRPKTVQGDETLHFRTRNSSGFNEKV